MHCIRDGAALTVLFLLLIPTTITGQCELLEIAPPVGVRSLAVDGDHAAIGSTGYTPGPGFESAGGVQVYERLAGIWTPVTVITAPDLEVENQFGKSVAIDGDTMVVGAWYEDDPNGFQSGAAYVYRFVAGAWQFETKISASDGDPGDEFGWEVAIDGDVIVVGARWDQIGIWGGAGSAYVFRDQGNGTWGEEAKLTADSPFVGDFYGMSVAVEGNLIAVGAPFSEEGPYPSIGAAFVYRFDGTTWNSEGDLLATIPEVPEFFGREVAVASARVIVGSSRDDVGPETDAGAVHVFEHAGVSWSRSALLTASDAAATAEFGNTLEAVGDTLIVGAQFDPELGFQAGAAYRFDRVGGIWTETKKFHSATTDIADLFTRTLAADAESVFVGAPSDGGSGAGTVSFFSLDGPDCNENSLCDDDDIAAGTSLDTDLSGIPDECETPEAPVSGLACSLERTAVRLDWQIPTDAGFVEVRRDTVLVATLPGESTTFIDADAPAGSVDYTVIRTGIGLPSSPEACTVIVPPFLIAMTDATAFAGDSVTVEVLVENPDGPVEAFSYGICPGPGTITGAGLGVDLLALDGGAGPSFSNVDFVAGGITHEVVTGGGAPPTVVLPAGGSFSVLSVTIDLPVTAGSFTVDPCGGLGVSLVPLEVTSGGVAAVPNVESGTVDALLAPVTGLTCSWDATNGTVLNWQNSTSYTEVTIVRDGIPILTLPGSATNATDSNPAAGYRDYEVVAGQGAVTAEAVACQVTVAPPPLENFVCTPVGPCSYNFSVSWDLPANCPGAMPCCYDSIDISIDGQFLDDTDGCALDCCASQLSFPGPGTYNVCVDVWIMETNPDGSGTLIYAPTVCQTVVVDPIPPSNPPTDLICEIVPNETLEIAWTLASDYAQLTLFVDGTPVDILPGTAISTTYPLTPGSTAVDVCLAAMTTCGAITPLACCTATAGVPFIRGDANADGAFDLSDPIRILVALFGTGSLTCLDAADVNADLGVNVADAIGALGTLFAGASPPPAPFPSCGLSAASLDCGEFAACAP